MKRPQAYRPFIRRRVRRLYPTFLVVFAMYVALSFAVPSESELPGSLVEIPAYLLFNLLLLPGIVPVSAFITVAWSLSYEFFFYLTVPLLISKFDMRERSPEWRWRFLMRFGVAVLLLGGLISGTHPRMVMFFGGMLLWEWMTNRWPSRSDHPEARQVVNRLSIAALVVGVLSPLVLTSDFLLQLPRIAVLAVAWPLLCAGCFAVDGACRRWFSWTPLRLLGNISYSYYLMHALVLQALFFALEFVWEPTADASWLYFAGMVPVFAATVAASVVLFLLVEKPLSLDSRTLRLIGRRR